MARHLFVLGMFTAVVGLAGGCTSSETSRGENLAASEQRDASVPDGVEGTDAMALDESRGDVGSDDEGADGAPDSSDVVDVVADALMIDGAGDGQEAEDCTVTPCEGLSYCDVAARECKPGCVKDSPCGPGSYCDVPTHTCHPLNWKASITTSMGTIVVALDAKAAPITVENFVKYADASFYEGLIFHRVIAGFMIQGGGLYPDMTRKDPLFPPITNEAASSGLSNKRGTIAMARTSQPDSAQSQFFINVVDNPKLDATGGQAGYCVFGQVIEGMGVVDEIEKVPTHTEGGYDDVPRESVVIESLVITKG